MAMTQGLVLQLVKQRLNRLPDDTALDVYLTARIDAAKRKLERMGIHLEPNDENDAMLVVDLTVWRYQNRDVDGSMPQWLKQEIRYRWLQQRQVTGSDP